MGLLVGLLVATMVEVFFSFSFLSVFSAVVGGCGWLWWLWMWMWRFLSAMIFFSFFLSGGYQWQGQD